MRYGLAGPLVGAALLPFAVGLLRLEPAAALMGPVLGVFVVGTIMLTGLLTVLPGPPALDVAALALGFHAVGGTPAAATGLVGAFLPRKPLRRRCALLALVGFAATVPWVSTFATIYDAAAGPAPSSVLAAGERPAFVVGLGLLGAATAAILGAGARLWEPGPRVEVVRRD